MLQMQTLASLSVRPRFVELLNRSWLKKPCSLRAFSTSSSSSNYSNQSRGSLPRFFSEILPSIKGGVVRVQGDEFWHMTKVLRLRTNDRKEGFQFSQHNDLSDQAITGPSDGDFPSKKGKVELFNGKGGLIEGCIQSIDHAGVDVLALEDLKLVPPQSTQWHVFAAFGTLKGGRADWLVEKCTELGANSVTPLLTERSPSISENRVDRLQRVNLAAAKQCQRLHEMILHPPMKIAGLFPFMAQSKLSFVAMAEATPLVNALTSLRTEPSGLIVVGPEGDFTEKEVNMMMEAGATAVGLGPHRLRVETATMALLATLMLWSDSQQMSL